MTAKNPHFKNLQDQVKQLEETKQSQEAEIALLQFEIEDVLKPSVAMTEITYIVSEMLSQNIAFAKKNGLTDKVKKSREQLIRLMDVSEVFNRVTIQNRSLQLHNKSLYHAYQMQRIDNLELKNKLDAMQKAFDGLGD